MKTVAFLIFSILAVSNAFVPNSRVHHCLPTRTCLPQRQSSLSVTNWFQFDETKISLPNSNKVFSIFLPLIIASSLVSPAWAADTKNSVFTNDYSDPLHPECRRHIQLNPDGKTFRYSGTAVGVGDSSKGCTREEIQQFGIRREAVEGVLVDDNQLSFGNLKGVWEPAGSATTNLGYEDVDGIRWSDGNKWTVQKKTAVVQVGEIITFTYIGVSLLAGVKGVYNMYEKKSGFFEQKQ